MTDFDAPFNVEGMLRKLALRYVAILKIRGVGDFDDALQEARLAFLEIRDREPPQNWRMATWSRLYRSLRKRYDLKNKRHTRAMPTEKEGWQLSETVESREETEAPEIDWRRLDVLSEKERALLIAHYVGGEKILDLAKQYGLTIRTTRQYIYVARKKITGEWRLNEEKKRQWRRVSNRNQRNGTARKLVKRTYEEQLEHIRGQKYQSDEYRREYQRKRYAENREKILAKARDAYWRKKYANAEINDERKEKCD